MKKKKTKQRGRSPWCESQGREGRLIIVYNNNKNEEETKYETIK